MSSKMSCISSNFSSFFLNSLNDASEFSKYLSNGELKCTNFEEFQVFGCGAPQSQPTSQQQQLQYSHTHMTNGVSDGGGGGGGGETCLTLATATTALSTAGGVGNAPTSISLGGSVAATAAGVSAAAAAGATPTSSATIGAAAAGGGAALSNRWPTALATPNGHIHQSHHQQHPHPHHPHHHHHHHHHTTTGGGGSSSVPQHFDGSFEFIKYLRHSTDFSSNTSSSSNATESSNHQQTSAASTDKSSSISNSSKLTLANTPPPPPPQSQSPVSSLGLIDLDSSTSQKSRSASRKVAALLSSVSRASSHSLVVMDSSSSALDVFDHDSKQAMFDMQHNITSNGSSNSNESSLELLAFPNSHLNASNSNTSSEGGAGEFVGLLTGCSGGSVSGNGGGIGGGSSGGGASCSSSTGSSASASHTPKLLGNFVIKENFDVHSSHKVEEGIFQHMNKLPPKKKDTLKQMGVRFTGQMTLTDKSIVVENFIKFCEEYDIKDHRPWLSLNQCGLNKPEQIKFARYLGQGLPTFTLFCIYSNFKNLFCTKRTEIYTKDGYNLPYILDKTKRFLANTTADLKNMAAANDGSLEFVNSNSSGNNSNTSSSNSNASSCNSNSSATVNNNSSNSSNSSNNNGGSNNNNSSNINNNNNSHHSNHGQNNMNSYVTAAAAAQAAAAQAAAAAAAASAQQQQQQQQQHQQQQQQQHQHQHQHQQSAMDPRYGCSASAERGPSTLLPPPPPLPPHTGLTLPLPLPPPLGPPPRSLEHMIIYENFDVHETHRIEDGVCTHISRLPPKKQELLKQFGIQSSQQCLSNYEKYILIENFIKFCNEYQISDHRPFLDFHESALSKCEQLKFVRYLGQGLSNLTLNKIYVAFKDLMSHGRTEKSGLDNYNLDALLKKKRKNLYNRLHAAAPSIDITAYETAQHPHTRPLHAFAALNAGTQQQQHQQQQQRSEVCNDLAAQYSYAPQQR